MITRIHRPAHQVLAALSIAFLALHLLAQSTSAQSGSGKDWTQFRGPGAMGRADAKGLPLTWSDEKNIVWKTTLPGPGASSPIGLGDVVFLLSVVQVGETQKPVYDDALYFLRHN